MYQHCNGSRTLPRGFRYEEPKTPEPMSIEPRQPSPPRQRFKVRRRVASSLQAPTQQFLASVAAADVPVPTIEVAQGLDLEMPDREEIMVDTASLAPPYDRVPPKTPVPMLAVDTTSRPDWAMGSPSPAEDYFTRPASSLSDASDFSDDSFYSGRVSRPSDDGSCTSPESDISDPFQFPVYKSKGKAVLREDTLQPLNNRLRSKTRKDAPWSAAQSAHLWSTYMVYLQDPTVTPFRIGASTVPPEGVCHRVAREARRSWKGQKLPAVRRSTRLGSARASEKSGSATPTEAPKVYGAWPHASASTRNHLREMCRTKDSTSVSRHRHLQSPSPTPFTKFQHRPRTPDPRPSFSTKEIALSLTTSTAESMQPNGPLAQLACDGPIDPPAARPFPPMEEFKPLSFGDSRGMGISLTDSRARRLGSPFIARSYGPSSSKSLEAFDARPSPPRTQSDTIPHLRSPLQFNKTHSLNGTQKRRAQNDLEEELSPNGAIVRPSILNEQLFGTPLNQRRVRLRGFSLGDEALRHRAPGGIFQHAPFEFPGLPKESVTPQPETTPTAPTLLPPPVFDPPRLGSPFSESGPSNTFPRRLFQDGSATIKRSAFATMHQTRRSIESFDFGDGPSLQSRLQNLDTKLQQIREAAARQQ